MQISSTYQSHSNLKISDINDTFVLKLLQGNDADKLTDHGYDLIHDVIDSITLSISVLDDQNFKVTGSIDSDLYDQWKGEFKTLFTKA